MSLVQSLARGPSAEVVTGEFFALHVRPSVGPRPRYAMRQVLPLRHVCLSLPLGEPLLLSAPVARADVLDLLTAIQENQEAGLRLVTWGGVYHDLAILAEETGQQARLRDICRQHVDLIHHVMCLTDVPLPLAILRDVLKRHVDTRDARDITVSLREAATRCEEAGEIAWTVGDKQARIDLEGGWMTVEQATARSVLMRGYAPTPNWMRR